MRCAVQFAGLSTYVGRHGWRRGDRRRGFGGFVEDGGHAVGGRGASPRQRRVGRPAPPLARPVVVHDARLGACLRVADLAAAVCHQR